MKEEDDPELRESNHWDFITLNFQNDPETGGLIASHSPAAEMEDLRDEILVQINELEEYPPPGEEIFENLSTEGIPDEVIIPRDLSQKIVALFAISNGIMENQLVDIITAEMISEEYTESQDINAILHERGLKTNLDLARDLGLVDDGVYGQVNDVRKARNELVHDPVSRLSIYSITTERDRIQKAVRAPYLLSDVLGEVDPQKKIERP